MIIEKFDPNFFNYSNSLFINFKFKYQINLPYNLFNSIILINPIKNLKNKALFFTKHDNTDKNLNFIKFFFF